MPTLKAILGPTNTGKTHYALERMMGHTTGMIGLPLRLLAREVYDRVVKAKGARAVALVTGEERIIPDQARYWVCTVESMPVEQPVEFLAVDEIQLAEDSDRGHVFTDRILHARGSHETLLLGAETMREVLRDLDFEISTDTRQRFSDLHYAGPRKITKLPKRTAIVAFSAEAVYAIAEVLRRQKGGSAVVMGGLSPRTRNAQVALYQSGEVDYLVATDAIGMGLNLDVDHVAFAGRAKYDGRRHRWLSNAEIGQIAGRAGRFRDDGEFGETGDCPPFEEDLVHAVESHRYDPVTDLQWRNSDLDFRSIRTLIASLSRSSPNPVLRQNPHGLDEWVLRRMAEDEAIGPDIRGLRRVSRLWDLARLPDFRKAGHEGHARLVLGLAETLADPDARLSNDMVDLRLVDLDVTSGDISQLQQRLAMIRTWTYAAFRPDWLENPEIWRETTRAVEDRLSDALHEALTLRFVDRRTTALIAGLKREDLLTTDVSETGEVTIEGHLVGKLVGLDFQPDTQAATLEGRTLRNAAITALEPVIGERLKQLSGVAETALSIDPQARILWNDAPIAQLVTGPHWLAPSARLIGGADAERHQREAATIRVNEWLGAEIARRLPTHFKLKFSPESAGLEGLARGLAFRLLESGAAVDTREDERIMQPAAEDRLKLKQAGIRAGRVAAYVPDAQKPAAQRLIALLQTITDGRARGTAPEGAGSFELDQSWTNADLTAQGYLRYGKRAVRADLAERLGWELSKRRKDAGKAQFEIPPELASVVSCPLEDFQVILKGFGLVPAEKDTETGAVKLWRFQSKAALEERAARAKPRGDTSAGDTSAGDRPESDRPRSKRPGKDRRPHRAPPSSEGAQPQAEASAPPPGERTRPPRPRRGGERARTEDARPPNPHGVQPHRGKDTRRNGEALKTGSDRRPQHGPRDYRPSPRVIDPNNPFAVLAVLLPPEQAPPARRKNRKPDNAKAKSHDGLRKPSTTATAPQVAPQDAPEVPRGEPASGSGPADD